MQATGSVRPRQLSTQTNATTRGARACGKRETERESTTTQHTNVCRRRLARERQSARERDRKTDRQTDRQRQTEKEKEGYVWGE